MRTTGVSVPNQLPNRRLITVSVGKTQSQIMNASWCLLGGGELRWERSQWWCSSEFLQCQVDVLRGLAGAWPPVPRTARATSSATRSALRAIAAADPSPAAVITCARGLVTLPATQTPGTLVRPVASMTRPAVVVEVAAELDEQGVVGDKARRNEERIELDHPLVVELEAAQLVILDHDSFDGPVNDGDRTSFQSSRSVAVRVVPDAK